MLYKILFLFLTLINFNSFSLPIFNDPLLIHNPSTRLVWTGGTNYTADSYQYYIQNTGQSIRVYNNETLYSTENGTNDINLKTIWGKISVSNVRIAVLDPDGFDINHEDLIDNILLSTNADGGAIPIHYHGTGVASIIGAKSNNGIGMAGIAQGKNLILVKFNNRSDISFSNAVNFCISNDVKVICFPSWLYNSESNSNSLVRAKNHDILFVCAAPNSHIDLDINNDYPTSFKLDNVITITCSMMDGKLLTGGAAWGSNTVFCAAPGRRIPVCIPNNEYGFSTGSSYSCAIVAGVAGVLRSYFPGDNYQATILRLKSSVNFQNHLTITGGVIDSSSINTTLLRLSIAGDINNIEYSTNLHEWHLFFIKTNENMMFFRGF